MKLSVCISVHNTEKYLKRCLESVAVQNMDGLELILVNNGSTDGSAKIMRNFLTSHPEMSISIYEQEDRGLAQGRQTGVNHASGEYITFLDADDYVLPSAYTKLYQAAIENDLDVVEMETKHGEDIISSGVDGTIKCRELFKAYCKYGEVIPTMLWMRIYRKSLFKKPVFPQIYMNNEDYFAFPCLMLAGDRMGFVKEVLHVYSKDNSDSVMTRLEKDPAFAKRFYETQILAMNASDHIWNYLEPDKRAEVYDDLMLLKRNHIVTFLFRNYPGKRFNDKIQAVMETMGFATEKEIDDFLKEQAKGSGGLDSMIRLIGVRKAHSLVSIRNHFRG